MQTSIINSVSSAVTTVHRQTALDPVRAVIRAGRLTVAALLTAALPAMSFAQGRLAGDAHTSSLTPTTKLGENAALSVSATGSAYLVFDFSSLPVGTTGAAIRKAVLTLWVSRVTVPGKVALTRLNGAWSEATIVHNTAPPLGTAEAGDVSITKAKQFVTIDVTQLVKDTLDFSYTNYGLAIVPQDATVNVGFDSKESTTTSHEPSLTLYMQADSTVAAGGDNVFAGNGSGQSSTGDGNTFVGAQSGLNSSTGGANTFIVTGAGRTNTTESGNTLLGALADIRYPAGVAPGSITNATAIGARAIVSRSNSLVLGNGANVGIGTSAPSSALDVVGDIRFGNGGLGCIMDRSGAVIAGKCASAPAQFVASLRSDVGVVPIRSFAVAVDSISGKRVIRLSLERVPDQFSPLLMAAVHQGRALMSSRLEIFKSADPRSLILAYVFRTLYPSTFNVVGSAKDNRVETIELLAYDNDVHDQLLIDDTRLVNQVAALPADTRPVAARATLTAGSTVRTFDLLDYSWEAVNNVDPATVGRVTTQGFKLTKAVDEDSKFLWTEFLLGRHWNSIVIDVLAANGTTSTRFTFGDAQVGQMQFAGQGVDVNVPTDEFLLKFTTIAMQSTAQDGTTVTRTWDYTKNTP
jgi:type VI protein secretion system component Hcp